jgi:hypothetical protein
MTWTSIYVHSCIVCFNYFLLVGVCYISYGVFQIKVYKIGSCYSARKTIKEKLVLCKNSVSLISLRSRCYVLRQWTHSLTYTDVVNPHNRRYDVPLATGTPVVVDDVEEIYLGYYD